MATPRIEAFLEMMSAERAAARNTLTAYGKDLADAHVFTRARGRALEAAEAGDVEAYFAELSLRGLSPATAARRRAAVRQFFRFALEEGWRKDDPSRRVDAPRRGRALPKLLSREEVERLIAAAAALGGADGARLACMVEILYAAGLRVSELTALPLQALARDPAFLIVRGKGGRERLAPLNGAARAAVKDYLALRRPSCRRGTRPIRGPSPRMGERARDPAAGRPTAGRGRRARGPRPGPGQPARAAPRLRHPSAGGGGGPAHRTDPARPQPTSPPPRSTPT